MPFFENSVMLPENSCICLLRDFFYTREQDGCGKKKRRQPIAEAGIVQSGRGLLVSVFRPTMRDRPADKLEQFNHD